MIKKFATVFVAAIAAFTLVSKPVLADDIVATASANPNFSTLVTALKAAGLVKTLQGAGPFTVFAPTNAAFAKLPKAQLNAILKNKAELTAILTYHVVAGKVLAADVLKLKNGTKVKTVEGSSFKLTNKPGVMVDKAKVIKTDIICDNGVIHVIDSVILPADLKSKMGKMTNKMGKMQHMAKPM